MESTVTWKHKGRFAQTGIYLMKFLRMFVFQNDWKVLPMGAFIAALVTFVVGANMFVTQEGTVNGTFALTCVCIWNGFFNSIQVVCRERNIIKREHRAGLHMSAYIAAHMIYQMLLCITQAAITLLICAVAGVVFPAQGVVTPWGALDLGITLFLTIYAADMLALMVSSIVRTTTTAMTVMPFLLIVQLVFSGAFFELAGFAQKLTALTISRWGMESLCAIGRYNDQPMVTLWNTMYQFRNIEYMGQKPILNLLIEIETNGSQPEFLLWSGQQNSNPLYEATASLVLHNWLMLVLLLAVFAVVAVVALEFIDRDKR
ncbi:MAG: ABC transporter permease [Clostridia bacterium]|nr:ABC transporter permease [Clostridia bacterium]